MTIETVVSAKSIWYGDLRKLNPRGRNLFRVIVPQLQHWYGFTPPQEFDEEKGVRFTTGEFSPSGRGDDLTGIELTVYHNGFVAMSTTSTDDTDKFLETVCSRLANEGLISYRPEMITKRQYSSEVVARSDRELVIPKLDPVYAALNQAVYGGTANFSWFGLSLDLEPLTPGRQIPFKFERRASEPFNERLWYSHGPLQTKQHQQILDAIEKALGT